jgi:hypothetical protein
MFTWMRTHQRKLMLVITILTIAAFTFFYSSYDSTRLQQDEVLRIYDRNVSYSDFQRAMRKLQLALSLGLTDYAVALTGGNEQNAGEFAVNAMIVAHEGKQLGLAPDDEAVANAISALPVFQTNGQFDSAKYELVFQSAFAPQGFTRGEIDELVRNSLTFARIKALLDTAPASLDADTTRVQRAFQPVSGVAIVFDREEFLKTAAPSDAKVEEFLKTNAARFVTPEWRTVQFVRFPLPADIDKLEGKAKIDAQQKVASASDDFATKAVEIGFDKAAQQAGLKVETTPAFNAQGGTQPGTDAGAAAAVLPALAPAVFSLSEKDPVSRVLQSGNEFLVAKLVSVTPSRAMTPAEAKPQIVEELTATSAGTALKEALDKAVADARAALKAGKPFAEATKGLKTKPFTAVSLSDEKTAPEDRDYASATILLEEGELGGGQPGPMGGFAVWLEKRLPLDQKKFDEVGRQYIGSQVDQRRELLWREWITKAQEASGLKFAPNGGAEG